MRIAGSLLAACCLVCAPAWAQESFRAPRTSSGVPDLQGVWSSLTATPLERPPVFDGPTTTAEKAAAFAIASPEAFQADNSDGVGARVSEWWEFGAHMTSFNGVIRTALIVDPADGQLPFNAETRKQTGRAAGDEVELGGPDGGAGRMTALSVSGTTIVSSLTSDVGGGTTPGSAGAALRRGRIAWSAGSRLERWGGASASWRVDARAAAGRSSWSPASVWLVL